MIGFISRREQAVGFSGTGKVRPRVPIPTIITLEHFEAKAFVFVQAKEVVEFVMFRQPNLRKQGE